MDGENDNMQEVNQSAVANDDYLPPDAKPLCPRCLQPCDPLQYYCSNCDSNEVINPLASYMPYLRIRFNIGVIGKLYRLARNYRVPLILRILFWIIIITSLLYLAY